MLVPDSNHSVSCDWQHEISWVGCRVYMNFLRLNPHDVITMEAGARVGEIEGRSGTLYYVFVAMYGERGV